MRMKPETREAIQKMNADGASEDDIAEAVKMKVATVRSVLRSHGNTPEPTREDPPARKRRRSRAPARAQARAPMPSVPAGVVDELDALRKILGHVAVLGPASRAWLKAKLETELADA